MRFLVDQCLSASLAEGLVAAGHDAVHTAHYGLSRAGDDEILARAAEEGRVLISADTDFGGLLANLTALEADLDVGAIAVIDDRGIRIRRLPIGG